MSDEYAHSKHCEQSYARPKGGQRFAALDLLRFLAAMGVLLYHYVSSYLSPSALEAAGLSAVASVTRYGYLGVNAFFLISGFVILASALPRGPVDFVIGRVSRLYPAFWVSVIITSAMVLLLPELAPSEIAGQLSTKVILANLTMMPEFLGQPFVDGVYWTLQIEIRFYFLVFLMLVLKLQQRVQQLLWIWLAILLLGEFFRLPWLLAFVFIAGYGSYFVFGCFAFLGVTRGWNRARALGLVVSAAMCIGHAFSSRSEFITPDQASGVVVSIVMLALMLFFCFGIDLCRGERLAQLAEQVGSLTYPLYLTHAVLGYMAMRLLIPSIGAAAALLTTLLGAIALAFLLTRGVDVPVRKPFAGWLKSCWRGGLEKLA